MTERIASGIYGLDELIGGGFRKNTISIINGGIGVGKTTFGLQFALSGLSRGEKAVFLSFEMEQKQIVADSKALGLEEIEEHIEQGNLKIIQLFAEDMMLPRMDIPDYIRPYLTEDEHIRIIIDPLTHFSMYLEEEEKEKRKQISSIFQDLRYLGTTIITLEESQMNGADNYSSIMPLYLADTVLHLHYLGFGEYFDRTIRVVKHRGSNHGQGLYPYSIEKGMGLVVQASESDIDKLTPNNKYDKIFKEAISEVKDIDKIGPKLARRIQKLSENWVHEESPEYILKLLINYEKK